MWGGTTHLTYIFQTILFIYSLVYISYYHLIFSDDLYETIFLGFNKIIYLQIVKSSSIKHLDFIGHISHDYMTMIYSKKENPYLRRVMPSFEWFPECALLFYMFLSYGLFQTVPN